MDLTTEIIFGFLQSDKEFPIDFDDAIEWWDCRTRDGKSVRRDSLVRKLKVDYYEHSDYHLHKNEEVVQRPQGGGSGLDKYFLTVECFKMMGMQVSGERGRQIRQYFLNCEKELKRRIEQDQERYRQRIAAAFINEKHSPWQKRFEDEFFDEAYRVTGWKPVAKGHAPCMGGFIKKNLYDWYPKEVLDRLTEVNPRTNGRLKRKHHQHLKQPGLVFLETQKMAVLAVMRLSPDNNPKKFTQNMDKALGNAVQLELPLIDEI